jgi:hypothetical protein
MLQVPNVRARERVGEKVRERESSVQDATKSEDAFKGVMLVKELLILIGKFTTKH